ncbi:hypothetical protein FTT16_08715 [Campylobacter jejuni]|nr:hypothetical protein [Campylobacter jejuni]
MENLQELKCEVNENFNINAIFNKKLIDEREQNKSLDLITNDFNKNLSIQFNYLKDKNKIECSFEEKIENEKGIERKPIRVEYINPKENTFEYKDLIECQNLIIKEYDLRLSKEKAEKIEKAQKENNENQDFIKEEIEKNQDFIKDKKDFFHFQNQYKTPLQILNNLRSQKERINENEEISEAIENYKLLNETQEKINEFSKKAEEEKNQLKKEFSNEQDKIQENPEYLRKKEELDLKHNQELKELEELLEKRKNSFENSINNLCNANSFHELLKSLYEMDKALALIVEQGFENLLKIQEQRKEKLELAFESAGAKELVKDLIKELNEKNNFSDEKMQDLDRYSKYFNELENADNLKDFKKMEEILNKIEREEPLKKQEEFKRMYRHTFEKAKKNIEKNKENQKNQNNTKDKENQGMEL